jgi:probable phosphoglycerate mutase
MTSRPVPLVVLRHGPTDWNAERRIQGRSDRPLSEAGRAAVRRWSLPVECSGYDWITSPLLRARETAALMGHDDAVIEAALIETDWGQWEGRILGELRDCLGAEMLRMEARGLDFRPPDGESPRDVQARLAPWLTRVAAGGRPCVAVCHKGVIRALAALASGWNMTGPPPEKLRDAAAHRFVVGTGGTAAVGRLNLPLVS